MENLDKLMFMIKIFFLFSCSTRYEYLAENFQILTIRITYLIHYIYDVSIFSLNVLWFALSVDVHI